MASILIVDDEPSIRLVLKALLKKMQHTVTAVSNGMEALDAISNIEPDLIITDVNMPKMDGMELLKKCKLTHPHIPVVILTAHGTVHLAVEAMKIGASDFLSKPFDKNEIRNVLDKTLAESKIQKEQLHEDEQGRFNIIGRTKSMQSIYKLIEKVAVSNATALIVGESGTGKELVARALHENSDRKDKPFILLNCGAIPENLFESELFGHDKGAFTGAHQSKPGKFELADKGTLFLDEIGELPKDMQVKLLRTLQDGTYDRVGGLKSKTADVRLVAATNRDLPLEIKEGRFREDLFYRLNVIPIMLPPLRTRREDISLLSNHFIEKASKKFNRSLRSLTQSSLNVLNEYDWPGNIRELENIIERAVLLAESEDTHLEIKKISHSAFEEDSSEADKDLNLKEFIRKETAKLEVQKIQEALNENNGNVTHAAKHLGISRKSLQNKMREYGLRDS